MFSEIYQSIDHWINLHRTDRARVEVERALRENPADSQLLYYSALIHWLDGEYRQGIEVAESGLSSAPEDEDLRYILFKLLKEAECYSEAEELIIQLILTNPKDTRYLCGYAELMLVTFHLSKAGKLIAEALRISPNDTESLLIATLIDIARGQLKSSEEKLQELIAEHPESEHILRLLLVQLVKRKKHRSALLLAQEILRRNPQDLQLIELIIQLKTITHWSALPLWPINRFGWVGSIGMWAIFILLVNLNDKLNISWFSYVTWGYLGWCLYTWLHGPLFNKLFKVRGI